MTLVKVSDDSTRDDIALALGHINDRAKMLSRTGRRGTDSPAYADLHETLDELVAAIRRAE